MAIQMPHRTTEAPRLAAEQRREMRALFRCMLVHQERAAMLDVRADRSANPVLAGVLRERAVDHRRRADGVRSHLVAEGALRSRPPGTLWVPGGSAGQNGASVNQASRSSSWEWPSHSAQMLKVSRAGS